MKATGVVRRIDDLGRIVIPKEIRKTLRLKNGENLEIFVDENENIILKKYSQIDKLKEFAGQITEAINSITKKSVFIINTDSFVSTSGKKKGYLNEPISNELIAMITAKKPEVMVRDEDTKIGHITFKKGKYPHTVPRRSSWG